MIVIVAHLVAMRDARESIPASRYRLRTVNGGIMLATAPLLAAAFSVVPASNQRLFVIVWFACIGLLGLVVMIAVLDAINNARLMVIQRRRLREEADAFAASVSSGDSPGRGHAE